MIHRATWIAIPVISAVVLGAGLGWWGYLDQYRQREALVSETEGQYASAFHGLVSDVHNLQGELGKTVITNDNTAFQGRLRDIWRLSFAAQSEIGKLPFALMPMHHMQEYLSQVSTSTEGWMKSQDKPSNAGVHKQLQKFYDESNQLSSQLSQLQGKVLGNDLHWLAAQQALNKKKTDNQIVDGFRKIDTSASSFVESQDSPSSLQRGRTIALAGQAVVNGSTAVNNVKKFVGVPNITRVSVTSTHKGAYVKDYIVTGDIASGSLYAVVSQNGGHVLQLGLGHQAVKGSIDLLEAQQKSQTWLQQRGFGKVSVMDANEYDHTGYFVFAPLYDNVPNLSQGIVVKVALDSGQVISYDGSNYYYYPVRNLPARKYTAAQLKGKLNPAMQVRMSQDVICLDENNHYQPAVAFYGTSNKETYRVFVNANTGKEMTIEQLTNH
ncbi:germination protein YpeB [Alicyclobacillus tolerans]|uniref:PepSY1/2 domain-containing protein n=1 Tax=Alicyclobacillus tolerans TaxID=90970 RepID=UPI001F41E6CE|nr:PepSY1/2 domain-containing protein [Alicyclobacillus tolerans]MCF8563719.1 germination protein YpeB [Alicyclobacillus tolerans]